jgi:hypothetical protein
MTGHNNNASFVDFFRSVNFQTPRASAPAVAVPERHFYVPRNVAIVDKEQQTEIDNLVRSYN